MRSPHVLSGARLAFSVVSQSSPVRRACAMRYVVVGSGVAGESWGGALRASLALTRRRRRLLSARAGAAHGPRRRQRHAGGAGRDGEGAGERHATPPRAPHRRSLAERAERGARDAQGGGVRRCACAPAGPSAATEAPHGSGGAAARLAAPAWRRVVAGSRDRRGRRATGAPRADTHARKGADACAPRSC